MTDSDQRPLILDGQSLDAETLARAARHPATQLTIDEAARARVCASRAQIDAIVERYRRDWAAYQENPASAPKPVQDYGVTTGFGEFKDIPISPDELEQLQRNLLLSHAIGIGDSADLEDPGNYFPAEVVRAALLLRINAFLRGHSGVRPELVDLLVALFEAGIVPLVPTKGSMGSSGDLCPLSHLFNILLGEGRYYRVGTQADFAIKTRETKPASALAQDLGRELLLPTTKEGLALSNGATFSAAMLALAVADAQILVEQADVAAALSLEAACGCARALDPKIHEARGQRGQIESASHLRALLQGSRLLDSAGAVQDAYSLRCAPVVHGAARDTLAYARAVVERELNAATDNPLFFGDEEAWDSQFAANWPAGYDGRLRRSYSAGNFHGEPIAIAADCLAIAVAELANISERRCQLLLDHHHNRNLPANLIAKRGVNSGLMLAQYAAASLVAENKILAHPAAVDSIPTAANIEDHVALSTTAARKLRTIINNVEAVLAIEKMVAAQAIDWRAGMLYPPRKPQEKTETPTAPIGADEGPERVEAEAQRFREVTKKENRAQIAAQLGVGTRAAYLRIREVVEPMVEDRVLSEDVRRLRKL